MQFQIVSSWISCWGIINIQRRQLWRSSWIILWRWILSSILIEYSDLIYNNLFYLSALDLELLIKNNIISFVADQHFYFARCNLCCSLDSELFYVLDLVGLSVNVDVCLLFLASFCLLEFQQKRTWSLCNLFSHMKFPLQKQAQLIPIPYNFNNAVINFLVLIIFMILLRKWCFPNMIQLHWVGWV